MDITALMGNVTSLAILYGWVLVFAVVFSVGERVCRGLFGRAIPPSAPGAANEPANG